MQVVDFNQPDAGATVLAALDRGVGTGEERDENGGFGIVCWRNTGGLDLGLLIALPVVIAGDEPAIAVVQLQDRIDQWDRKRRLRLTTGRARGEECFRSRRWRWWQ